MLRYFIDSIFGKNETRWRECWYKWKIWVELEAVIRERKRNKYFIRASGEDIRIELK